MATIVAAMLTGAMFYLAFSYAIGQWSQPSLAQSGLLQTAAEVVRILEAAPPELRPRLAADASSQNIRIAWYASQPLRPGVAAKVRKLTGDVPSLRATVPDLSLGRRQVMVIRPQDPADFDAGLMNVRRRSAQTYILLVGMRDGGWAAFSLDRKGWGASGTAKAFFAAVMLVLSAALIAAVSARLLARPLQALSRDLQHLGVDRRAAQVAERGPVELRKVIAAINAMQARLQTFVESRTLLLATISHDLRTPLTRLRLRSELMQDEGAGRGLIGDIDEMSAMVQAAIAMFRDELEDEAPTRVDICALVQVVVEEFMDQGAVIALNLEGVSLARGRPYALKRALRNIVDNAVRYACDVEIEVRQDAGLVRIDVCDRGPGLPQEALEKVFRPFLRVGGAAGRRGDGLGLGLTSAHTVAVAHSGGIAAVNRVGGGLKVSLELPVAPEDGPQRGAGPS